MTNDNFRKADVYFQNIFAGVLSETSEGYAFQYDKEYLGLEEAHAVSLTLPLQEKPFLDTRLFSFFDGLIPEGWLFEKFVDCWKLDRHDRFGILLVACSDCIGAVSIKEAAK